ncbi:MAG: response regulator [Chloroflexi bacterium]|nr:response regulator [Chloroflexota bacterium]
MTNRNELTAPNSEPKGRILVVDDEIELTNALVEMLNKQSYQAIGFTDGNKALERLKQESFDILLADLMMPAIDGITLLKSALQIDPNIVGLIMTGQGTVQTAVDAMKSGAFDYILKPFKLNAVLITLAKSLEVRRLRMENITLRETVSIYELGQLVSSTLDSRAIAHKTAEAVRQQSDADEVSILVPVTGGEEMVVVAASGGDREFLVDQRVPKANTIAGWVANNQEMLTLEGEVMDERFSPAYPRPEIIRAISLPMVLNKNLIGVMNVNITNKPRNLSEGQIRGLQTLANIAASALENARLYQETEERLRRLDALRRIDLAISSSMDIRISLDVLLDQVHTHLKVDASSVLLMDPASNDFYAAATRGFRSLAASRMRVRMGSGCVGRAAVERRTVPASDLDELKEDPLLTQLPVDEEI